MDKINIMNVNFISLAAKEKQQIIYKITDILDEAAKDYTFMQKILAQTLFVSRCCHFLQSLLDKVSLPAPLLFTDMMEWLWRYLQGECSAKELEIFHRATESVLVYLLVDDDENLNQAAWEKYHAEYDNPLYFNTCLEEASELSYILEQIVTEKISWYELTDGELPAIVGNYIDDFDLEDVYKKEDGCYNGAEYERHWSEIYDSESFGRIFSLLIEDLRMAKEIEEFSKEAVERVRMKYQDKGMFEEEQIEKVAGQLKERYHLEVPENEV